MGGKLLENVKSMLGNEKNRIKLIVLLGAAAMLLLLLSECSSGAGSSKKDEIQTDSSEEYRVALESELAELIQGIDGAGKTSVMITLQSSYEYIYAVEERLSSDSSESQGGDGKNSTDLREDSESKYIIISTDEGEKALIRTQLAPSVAGVVVVCEGADDPVVKERIILAVTTALDISSKRVCVILSSN